MDNYLISHMFDWNARESTRVRLVNRALGALGFSARLVSPFSTGYMTNVEVRMNLYHLLSAVLAYEVKGDVVEIGCHVGETAALFQAILQELHTQKEFHVYDSFEGLEGVRAGEEIALLRGNFARYALPLPQLHKGWFQNTLPQELPSQISFAHIDIGPGPSPDGLKNNMMHVLESVFPRVSPGGVVVFADYVVRDRRPDWNVNLPVSEAIDTYFSGRPERPMMLYAGAYSHGFVRRELVPQ